MAYFRHYQGTGYNPDEGTIDPQLLLDVENVFLPNFDGSAFSDALAQGVAPDKPVGALLDTAIYALAEFDHSEDSLSDRRGSTSSSLGQTSLSSMSPPTYQHSPVELSLFSCLKCQKNFSGLGELHKHMKYHDKPIWCPKCDARFATPKLLKRHRDIEHTTKDQREVYKCPCAGCPKTFTRPDNRKRHIDKKHGRLGTGSPL